MTQDEPTKPGLEWMHKLWSETVKIESNAIFSLRLIEDHISALRECNSEGEINSEIALYNRVKATSGEFAKALRDLITHLEKTSS